MQMPEVVRKWAKELIEMCQPDNLHVMDGSEEEDREVCSTLALSVKFGRFVQLNYAAARPEQVFGTALLVGSWVKPIVSVVGP